MITGIYLVSPRSFNGARDLTQRIKACRYSFQPHVLRLQMFL
jgi:hypothetical protein